jgi:hypothetical protein
LGLEPPKPPNRILTDLDAPVPFEGPSARDLPDFAKKADDLEAIKKAVDDAAAVSGGLWLSYLFVVFYILVTTASVTDGDIFLENPIKLAILTVNLGVSLPGYFFLAPIVFVIVHAYTLVYFVMLGEKSKWFNRVLRAQIPDTTSDAVKYRAIRESLERQLASNIFVQMLAGPPELRGGPFGWLLRLIATVTLVVAPVLLLMLIQIRFLPYHSTLHLDAAFGPRRGPIAHLVALAQASFRTRGRNWPPNWALGMVRNCMQRCVRVCDSNFPRRAARKPFG